MFYDQKIVKKVFCLYRYQKKGIIQHLIHELKYRKNKAAGQFLGKQLALEIKNRKSSLKSSIALFLYPCIGKDKGNETTTNQRLLLKRFQLKLTNLWCWVLKD